MSVSELNCEFDFQAIFESKEKLSEIYIYTKYQGSSNVQLYKDIDSRLQINKYYVEVAEGKLFSIVVEKLFSFS